MKITKRLLADLNKCYALSPVLLNGETHYIVASEKEFPCLLLSPCGEYENTIWDKPGGTMSIVQLPGSNGVFLATQRFYSPYNASDASIIMAEPSGEGGWTITTVAKLPHVHRFDIIRSQGVNYLFACTIATDKTDKQDWGKPGKVFACRIGSTAEEIKSALPLQLEIIYDGIFKNHGYSRREGPAGPSAIVAGEDGIFEFSPPRDSNGWAVKKLSDEPTSEALICDIDSDGVDEMITFSPFHGDTLKVLKQTGDGFTEIYRCPYPLEFLHAMCYAEVGGKPCVAVGHRGGERDILLLSCDASSEGEQIRLDTIDRDVGSANVIYTKAGGKDVILSANRETDKVMWYELSY